MSRVFCETNKKVFSSLCGPVGALFQSRCENTHGGIKRNQRREFSGRAEQKRKVAAWTIIGGVRLTGTWKRGDRRKKEGGKQSRFPFFFFFSKVRPFEIYLHQCTKLKRWLETSHATGEFMGTFGNQWELKMSLCFSRFCSSLWLLRVRPTSIYCLKKTISAKHFCTLYTDWTNLCFLLYFAFTHFSLSI